MMKLIRLNAIKITALCVCFTQVIIPAKQSVKAYKTGDKKEVWTVAIFKPDNLTTPLSMQSFKSTTSIFPGRGLHFDFEKPEDINIIKVYPTKAKDAKVCIKSNNFRGCGEVISHEVTKGKTPAGSVIKIDVVAPYDYTISIDPPKKDVIFIPLKKSCGPADLKNNDCQAEWTVEIYDEKKLSTGVTKKLGLKTEQIRVPVRTPFWVYVTKKSDAAPIQTKIDNYGASWTKKNVMILHDHGEAFLTTKGSVADTLVDAQR